jgi:hypothetical protein
LFQSPQNRPITPIGDTCRLQKAWINDARPVSSPELAQLVSLSGPSRNDVLNYHTAHQKRIREQPPVALPPESLGAHYSCVGETSKPVECPNPLVELRRLHMICVTPKRSLTKGRVYGVWTRAAPPAQGWKVSINDACRLQRVSQCRPPELRMASRLRERADVRQLADAMCAEKFEEALR